ncbi:MAG: hydrogenase maturation peptidase HycI [Candidatus Bathyarchaeia archaeon]
MTYLEDLEDFLGTREARRVAILGIGSPIRGDDSVGLEVLDYLKEKDLSDEVLLLRTETVPESFTGEVRAYSPTHIILLDAAHFEGEPGEVRVIPPDKIKGQTVSTHNMPLSIFVEFLKKSITGNVILLGIQGVNIGFQESLTPSVRRGVEELADKIYKVLVK